MADHSNSATTKPITVAGALEGLRWYGMKLTCQTDYGNGKSWREVFNEELDHLVALVRQESINANVSKELAVTVDAQGVRFGAMCWYSHEKITGYGAEHIPTAPVAKTYWKWCQAMLSAQREGKENG